MNNSKRNFILMFADTVLFANAMTFLSVNTIITYYLSTLGASTFEIGLANALVSIGAFASQPVFAKQVINLSLKLQTFVKILMTQRIFFLLFICLIPLLSEDHPRLMVLLFLLCWAIFSWFTGSYVPFYISVFAKMIVENQRGRLRGFANSVGSIFALGSAYLAGVLLKEMPYPYNYTVIFAIGMILLIVDALVFRYMKEEPDHIVPSRINYIQYYLAIPGIFRENKAFLTIVIGNTFIIVSQLTLAYYALYAVRVFQAGASQIVLLAAITGLANIVGSTIFGIMADKYGHRLIVILSSALGAAGGFIVVGIPHMGAVYAAFALTNLCLSGYNISGGILIIENVHREKLPMCISINTMITLTVSSIVTIGGSFLVDYVSFASIFMIAGVAGLLGSIILLPYRSRKRLP